MHTRTLILGTFLLLNGILTFGQVETPVKTETKEEGVYAPLPEEPEVEAIMLTDESKEYSFVDKEPEFPGGHGALYKFIQDSLVYPAEAIEQNISGKVFLSFVVQQDGSISKVKVERGAHPLLDVEAIRVIRKSPNWIPGEVDGKIVASYFRIPIVFVLENDDNDKKKKN